MASASGYNYHRFARAVLKKARKWEPSLTVELFPAHWKFEGSQINFTYEGPMKPFLLALRSQVINGPLLPFLYDIHPPISFVDGCLVVEIQDHRKNPEVRTRVVMRPAPETLPQTIEAMLERRGDKWDEQLALELESRIISSTSAPLYLGTSILATRNAALSLALTAPAGPGLAADGSTRPTHPTSDDERSEVETMRKLLVAGSRSSGVGVGASAGGVFQPNWSILRLQERIRQQKAAREQEAAQRALGMVGNGGGEGANVGTTNGDGPAGGGGADGGEGSDKKKSKKKRPAEESAEGEKKTKKKKANGAEAVKAEAEKAEAAKPGSAKKKTKKEREKEKAEAEAAAAAAAAALAASQEGGKKKKKKVDKEKEKEKEKEDEGEKKEKKEKKAKTEGKEGEKKESKVEEGEKPKPKKKKKDPAAAGAGAAGAGVGAVPTLASVPPPQPS